MENFNIAEWKKNFLNENTQENKLSVHEVYEVYCEDEEGNERLFIFRSKEAFDGELGESLRDDFIIVHQGYANVNLTDADYQFILEKGWILW